MPDSDTFDWSATSAEEQLAQLKSLDPERRKAAICAYDWAHHPEPVLGWAMAQRGVELVIALRVFFNGGPERFNYIPKRQVPESYLGVTRVLDNICLRINSGFYLVYPGQEPTCTKELRRWLTYQQADRDERRRGRWILDEDILEPMLRDALRAPAVAKGEKSRKPSLLRDLLSPVIGLGVDRDVLKYRDRND
ncbi:hypothetical protein SAMN05443999_11467 [Roseovarius azorensis]|uniref:DUF4274 domain-containing protein n=1 Tax=Roseovarius azorensis TaxID=1287727 RepID=A0A1H7W7C3_9RHOB|nr:hypothetical protein [Roseovarius azorensis]SEM16955.1 hypothetical protein SAMN05443999_11467 [Roseovarius azorensis]